MEARFLHESEARASSWVLPVARGSQVTRFGADARRCHCARGVNQSRPAAGAAALGENNLLQCRGVTKIACAGTKSGWRSKGVRGTERENLPAPFWRNPFHSSSEIIRYVKLNYFSHSHLPIFCFSSLQPFRSTTPIRIDSGRTCSTGARSKVPYKLRMTSSTWLFSYELCSCRSCFPSCKRGYPHHPAH
jgi:hypothetical protein